ncbi:hypothetical protein IAI58_19205 (plasmid) [Roseomonas marmotae]|uniref:hypothetical protein n=1 Tax=Roseomonas marmotae TaxID=2768161 RepID=UPI001AD6D9D7|nr:hypothetical protein [Roseomonas marmotae]QTI81472.1 hypothetical protein IAI58_19205 [Roseomonas marmotae]
MTNLIRLAAIIIATATAIYMIATAPALWWLSESQRDELETVLFIERAGLPDGTVLMK